MSEVRGTSQNQRGIGGRPVVLLHNAARLTERMATRSQEEERLFEAFSVVADTTEMEETIARLRDLLKVDHIVYHSSKLGASPSADAYIRVTYPAPWVKQYVQMGYLDIDPVVREGFLRTLPFDWSELKIQSVAEMSFLTDAARHGVGPRGLSIPVRSKYGHRGLFSISSSRSEREWVKFRENTLSLLIQVANRLHQRVVSEVFGEDRPHLTPRELECLSWVAQGKSSSDIAVILNISPHTVRDFLKSARFKLDCVSSAQAVNKAVTSGLLVV